MDWEVFWTAMVVMMFWVPMIMIWVFALMDLFHRRDLRGLMKVVWLAGIVFLPILGVLLYFITKPADTWAEV